MLEVFPAKIPCKIVFTLSHSSICYSDKHIVEIPDAMIGGALCNLISNFSIVFFYLMLFHKITFLLQKIQTTNFVQSSIKMNIVVFVRYLFQTFSIQFKFFYLYRTMSPNCQKA